MTPEQLAEKILQALAALADDGTITVEGGLPRELKVERPKNPEHGDYATNVAMQLGKRAGHEPAPVRRAAGRQAAATTTRSPRSRSPARASSTSGSPPTPRARSPQAIVDAGPSYGTSDSLHGQTVNLEFISANPTGPLHLGHTRWAAVGDALARVLDRGRREGHPRVLHQRPRRPDGQVRRQPAGRGARSSRSPRTATTASTSSTSRSRSSPRSRTSPSCPRTSSWSRSARPGTSASSRSSRPSSSTSGPSSTSGSPSAACTSRTVSATRSRSSASRATCTTPTTRCGCGPRTSPTTRTGC